MAQTDLTTLKRRYRAYMLKRRAKNAVPDAQSTKNGLARSYRAYMLKRRARNALPDPRHAKNAAERRYRTFTRKRRAKKAIAGADTETLAAGAGGFTAGVLIAYLLDPASGKARRHRARDRAFGLIRRGFGRIRRSASQRARYAEGVVEGAVHEATPSTRDRSRLNDPALEAKVETEVLGKPEIPKERVNVNVENGVVYLRGELDSRDEISRIVGATSEVEGVSEVESLLHLPGEPAPTKAA